MKGLAKIAVMMSPRTRHLLDVHKIPMGVVGVGGMLHYVLSRKAHKKWEDKNKNRDVKGGI